MPHSADSASLPWYARPTDWRYWVTLFLLPSAVAVGVIVAVPFSTPMPSSMVAAQEYAATGHIQHISAALTGAGYSWVLGVGLRLGGIRGAEIVQALTFVGLVLLFWLCQREMRIRDDWSLFACLVVSLDPDLAVTVTRAWDVNLSAFAFLLLFWAMLRVLDRRSLVRVLALGLSFGWALVVRPNFASLLPAVMFVFLVSAPHSDSPSGHHGWKRRFAGAALASVLAAVTVIGLHILIHGSFFMAQNGPYNLYQGHNPTTETSLLNALDGESTVDQAITNAGIDLHHVSKYDPSLHRFYILQSVDYARAHPGKEVELAALKLFTVLRPNNKPGLHTSLSPQGLLRDLLALPIPLWIATLIRFRRHKWDAVDRTVLWTVFWFLLPFILIIADPRYRTPLDLLVSLHSLRLWAEHSRKPAGEISIPGSSEVLLT